MEVHSGHGNRLKRPESLVAWILEMVKTSLLELFFLKQSYDNKNQSYTGLA